MYQQVTVIGRVGKDLEMKGPVGKFSIATTNKWLKDGQKMEETTWFNCDLFGTMATGVGPYIRKGEMVHVSGRIKTNEYQGKHYWSVAVERLTLLSKPEGGSKPQEPTTSHGNLDDIPF